MAIDMMNYVEESVLDDGTSLTIKIGIHYGRAIAGVLGYHKPQFSLIGDTVNTTSRCCSTGLDAKITLSEQAYEQVAGSGYLFEERVIYAKGKGDMKTYVLRREGRDPNKSTRNRIPTLVNFDGRLKTQQKENDKSEISMNLFRLGGIIILILCNLQEIMTESLVSKLIMLTKKRKLLNTILSMKMMILKKELLSLNHQNISFKLNSLP